MNICQAEIAALIFEGQPLVINAELVKKSGMKIVNMYRILNHVVAVGVGLAQVAPRLDAASSHPNAETARMVVPTEIVLPQLALAIVGPAEFTAPNHQCIIEHTALLEIGYQRR